jgi:hypothetical protein
MWTRGHPQCDRQFRVPALEELAGVTRDVHVLAAPHYEDRSGLAWQPDWPLPTPGLLGLSADAEAKETESVTAGHADSRGILTHPAGEYQRVETAHGRGHGSYPRPQPAAVGLDRQIRDGAALVATAQQSAHVRIAAQTAGSGSVFQGVGAATSRRCMPVGLSWGLLRGHRRLHPSSRRRCAPDTEVQSTTFSCGR